MNLVADKQMILHFFISEGQKEIIAMIKGDNWPNRVLTRNNPLP